MIIICAFLVVLSCLFFLLGMNNSICNAVVFMNDKLCSLIETKYLLGIDPCGNISVAYYLTCSLRS